MTTTTYLLLLFTGEAPAAAGGAPWPQPARASDWPQGDTGGPRGTDWLQGARPAGWTQGVAK